MRQNIGTARQGQQSYLRAVPRAVGQFPRAAWPIANFTAGPPRTERSTCPWRPNSMRPPAPRRTTGAMSFVMGCKLAIVRALNGKLQAARDGLDALDADKRQMLGTNVERATLMHQVAKAVLASRGSAPADGRKALRGFLDQFRLNPAYRDSSRRETLELQLFAAELLLASDLESEPKSAARRPEIPRCAAGVLQGPARHAALPSPLLRIGNSRLQQERSGPDRTLLDRVADGRAKGQPSIRRPPSCSSASPQGQFRHLSAARWAGGKADRAGYYPRSDQGGQRQTAAPERRFGCFDERRRWQPAARWRFSGTTRQAVPSEDPDALSDRDWPFDSQMKLPKPQPKGQ